MMNIGYLVPEFPSQTHVIFWREITALRELGATVDLISTRRPPPDSCPHEFAEQAAEETYYVYPPRWASALATLATRPLGTLRAVRYLAGLRESPPRDRVQRLGLLVCAADLLRHARRQGTEHIHVHSCAEAAHLAALCQRLGGPSYSLTLHGDLPVYGTDHPSKMAGARFVMASGQHLKRQIVAQAQLPEERILLGFQGVNTDRFHDAGRRSSTPGRLHFGTVARLNFTKGHRHALAALRRALDHGGLDLTYSIAGDGPERAGLEAESARLRLHDHVRFLGALSEDEIVTLLQEIDAFVLPSIGLGEAFPSAVSEAMASGLPVVSSIIGGTPEMMTHGIDGLLIAQGDEAGLADALVALAEGPDLRRRLGAAARDRAVTALDRKITAARLLEAIASPRQGNGFGPRPVNPATLLQTNGGTAGQRRGRTGGADAARFEAPPRT